MLPNTQLWQCHSVTVVNLFFISTKKSKDKTLLHLDYCQLLIQLAGCSQTNPAWPLGFMRYFISWAVLAEGKQELILIILLNIRLMIIINQYRHLHNPPVKKKIKEISECQNVWFWRFDLWVKWLNEMELPVRVRRPTESIGSQSTLWTPHHRYTHIHTHTPPSLPQPATFLSIHHQSVLKDGSVGGEWWQMAWVLAAGLQFLTAKNPPFFCFDLFEKKNLVKWLRCRHADLCRVHSRCWWSKQFTPCMCNSWPSSEQSLQAHTHNIEMLLIIHS